MWLISFSVLCCVTGVISIHTEETINAAESVKEENTITEISDQCPDRKINENTCKSDRVEVHECSVENNSGVLRREKQRRTDNEEEEKRGEEEKTNGCSSNEGKQLVKRKSTFTLSWTSAYILQSRLEFLDLGSFFLCSSYNSVFTSLTSWHKQHPKYWAFKHSLYKINQNTRG
mgnify:CR=1 FL=1